VFRFFVRLKALVKNRAHPEGSIAEGYKTEECMTFCSRFIQVTTRFTRPSRNPEPSDMIKDMYLFNSAGESIGKVALLPNLTINFLFRRIDMSCDIVMNLNVFAGELYSILFFIRFT
jgi:hypothetical protein